MTKVGLYAISTSTTLESNKSLEGYPYLLMSIRGSYRQVELPITPVGLTACRGDSARDTVENTPMLVCVHACGGTDGARHAPNDLPRRVSGL
jgi:hypothetical protein